MNQRINKIKTNPVAINCELFEIATLVPLKQPKSLNLCKHRWPRSFMSNMLTSLSS